MKATLLALVLTFGLISTFAQQPCDKCKIEKVSDANAHLDSLTFQIVFDFLCTLDSTCKINVEFTEWSNEILFKILYKNPDLFFKAILTGQLNNKAILKVIRSPLLDYNIQVIYDKVKSLKIQQEIKIEFLNALRVADRTINKN